MHVFITGADGMLGSNVVRVLLGRGHAVTALIHPASVSPSLEGLAIIRCYGDILLPETYTEAMTGCDAVVHAAASTAVWPARSEKVRKINIDGTRNMIGAVLAAGIPRMVYIGSGSSVNATGNPSGRYRYPGARFGLDYNDSKYEALMLVLEAAKNRGLPALAVLPAFMIGPWDTQPGSGKMVLEAARGRMKFCSRGGRNFIHVADVAEAVANSLTMGEIGQYYIAAHENLTYMEFFTRAARITGRRPPRFCLPDWVVKAGGVFGSIAGTLLNRPPLLSYPMARVSCEQQFVSGESAVRGLGMPQTPVEKAIRDCYEWFAGHGYLSLPPRPAGNRP